MKRVTMGGTDVVVTDDEVADLLLEYARELGRSGATDTVTVPAAVDGEPLEASMLLGPASQITLTPDMDDANRSVVLARVEEARSDLRDRIARVTGRGLAHGGVPDAEESFVDFDEYDA